MRQKVVTIACDVETARNLALAIGAYADAAYPPGGSDCSQVAREELLRTATLCVSHTGGTLNLRRRQMPQLRAAVRWFFSSGGPGNVEWRPSLEILLANSK